MTTMKKNLLLGLLGTLALAACAAPSQDEDAEQGGSAIRGGATANGTAQTVALRFEDASGQSRGLCSGFLIGPHTVVTAAHCFVCGHPAAIKVFSPYPLGDGVAYAEWDNTTMPRAPGAMGDASGNLDYAKLSYIGSCGADGIELAHNDLDDWQEAHLDIATFKLKSETTIEQPDKSRAVVPSALGDAIGLSGAVPPPYIAIRDVPPTACDDGTEYHVDGAMTNGNHPLRTPAKPGQTLETSRAWGFSTPPGLCTHAYGPVADAHVTLVDKGIGIDKVAVQSEPGDSGGMMYIAAGRKDDASKIHKETAVAVQSLGDKTPIMLNGKPVGPFAVGVKLFPHKGFLEASYQAFEGNSVTF